MKTKTKYKNGVLKVKDPDNIKYEYDDLRKDIEESKAFNKFVRGKVGLKDQSKNEYITHVATYCYFHQNQLNN